METRQKAVSNTLYGGLDTMAYVLGGYLFWMLMGKMLLPEDYGVIVTISALYGLAITFVCLNASEVLGRFIPFFLERGERNKANQAVSAMATVAVILAVLAACLVFVFSGELGALYNNPKMVGAFRAFSILILAGSAYGFSRSILYGMQRLKTMFYTNAAGIAVKIAASAALLIAGYKLGGIFGWAVGFGLTAALCTAFALLYGARFEYWKEIGKRQLFGYSAISTLSSGTVLFISQIGTILLGSNLQNVGIYGVGLLFGNMVAVPLAILQNATFPLFSALWSGQRTEHFNRLAQKSLKYVTALSLPLLAIMFLFPQQLISLVYTNSYASAALPAGLYSAGFLLFSIANYMTLMLYAAGAPKSRAKIMLIGAILSAIFSYALISLYGVMGASLAMLATASVMLAFAYAKMRRLLAFRLQIQAGKLFPALALFVLLCLPVRMFVQGTMETLTAAAFILAIYLAVLLKTKLLDQEDLAAAGSLSGNRFFTKILNWTAKKFA